MSFNVYVGNYPLHFNRSNVADIFREYDGIKVERFFKKDQKCYSFLLCKDFDQLVSVIKEKNNTIVSGRQLRVRAQDEKLQEYVELMLRETDGSSATPVTKTESPSYVPLQVLKNETLKHRNADVDDARSCSSNYSEKRFSDDKTESAYSYEQPNNSYSRHSREKFAPAKSPPLQVSKNEALKHHYTDLDEKWDARSCSSNYSEKRYSDDKTQSVYSYEQPNNSYSRRSREERFDHATYPPSKTEALKPHYADLDEKWDVRSYSSNHSEKQFSGYKSDSTDSYKEQNKSYYEDQDAISELCWVSVTNFPLGTSKRALFHLFSDYEPVDVFFICNQARRDRTITEAFVAFLNQDIADDVILNFDNTHFRGRILLVNDIDDLTVMNELMNGLKL